MKIKSSLLCHNNLQLDLSQMNTVSVKELHFCEINFNTDFLSILIPPTILFALLIFPMSVTCPTDSKSFHLVTLVTTNYVDPHYTIFPTFLFCSLPQVYKFSSAPFYNMFILLHKTLQYWGPHNIKVGCAIWHKWEGHRFILDVIGFSNCSNPSSCIMALGLIQPLTDYNIMHRLNYSIPYPPQGNRTDFAVLCNTSETVYCYIVWINKDRACPGGPVGSVWTEPGWPPHQGVPTIK
jgi:hypothetical protein